MATYFFLRLWHWPMCDQVTFLPSSMNSSTISIRPVHTDAGQGLLYWTVSCFFFDGFVAYDVCTQFPLSAPLKCRIKEKKLFIPFMCSSTNSTVFLSECHQSCESSIGFGSSDWMSFIPQNLIGTICLIMFPGKRINQPWSTKHTKHHKFWFWTFLNCKPLLSI